VGLQVFKEMMALPTYGWDVVSTGNHQMLLDIFNQFTFSNLKEEIRVTAGKRERKCLQ
jgi:hypothetical protein